MNLSVFPLLAVFLLIAIRTSTYHAIIGVSVVLSQGISNVPLVALYQPAVGGIGVPLGGTLRAKPITMTRNQEPKP